MGILPPRRWARGPVLSTNLSLSSSITQGRLALQAHQSARDILSAETTPDILPNNLRGAVIDRPYLLAGAERASAKQIKEDENAQYNGGMRNPGLSNTGIPGAQHAGRRIRRLLERFLQEHPECLQVVHGSR